VIKQIHQRIVKIAQENGVAEGGRMRVDTTVVETNIHYPTDSSLLGDVVRMLILTKKNITDIVGKAGASLRDRSGSVRVLDIARAARAKGKPQQEQLKRAYGQLLNSTSRVGGTGETVLVKRSSDVVQQLALDGLRHELDAMVPLVKQVMKQTRARIFHGETHSEGKLISLFEPSRRSSAKARRPSRTNSARWSNCRKPKTRS
jgi:IS5 family transposase